ncbi:response regulator [Roseateles toxinivorans]|uniref:Hpt domain-containing protein n=1 Tax=Roseateles toxinivorans TaxID=270368 RepID=A0A4R6QHH0_9BURK|nr:response regulator [Roseateles toxinivorans]TDP62523.1 Hpt domain-containing protein [Roseateles toxinivorans]
MPLPRVLLVEDDPSLQRFVQLALEELPITLLTCDSVADALAELARAPVALLITDLMLPDRSGLDLLAQLQREPALRGAARLAVFSAGLLPAVRLQLQALDVWRMLAKPCSIMDLEACVLEAMPDWPAGAVAAMVQTPTVVESHFGGNTALYEAFRASCLQQFVHDVRTGDLACEHGDSQALRRLAHSLKSVLESLGHGEAAALARALETRADQGDWVLARPLWQALRSSIQALV